VKAERATAKVALLAFLFLFSTDIPAVFQSISNNWYFGTSSLDVEFYIHVYIFMVHLASDKLLAYNPGFTRLAIF
jgi:hypothetical protein